jgi:hypothetical protein
VLRAIGLSHARHHDWIRADRCGLDDRPSCPRSSPQQLTLNEVNIIRDMVTSNEYRHVSTGVIARLAQRLGKVFASPTTWYQLVRDHQWLYLNTLDTVATVRKLVTFYTSEHNTHLPHSAPQWTNAR